ncbi:MAG: PsbP-related protein [Candidatus Bathyarchaeia archaeon]
MKEGIPVIRMKILKWMVSTCAFLLLTITFLGISVFGAVSPQAYVNRTHGFSINPPSGWTVNDTGLSPPVIVIFYGPVMPETGGKININIGVETTSLTLNQYVSVTKSQYAASALSIYNLSNYNLVSESSRSIGGLNGYELVFTCTYMPGGNVSNTHSINFKQKQVIFVERAKAYILTFSSLTANYDSYLPAFEESLQTFKLLGQEPPWLFIGFLIGGVIVVGIICYATISHIFEKRKMKRQQQRIEGEMLDVLRHHKSIKIEDLAKMLETKEADIELAVVQLRKNGEPINFNRETREVIYEKQE